MSQVPGGDRVYYSARWARRLAGLWRSPNRNWLAFPLGHFHNPMPDYADIKRDADRLFAPHGPDMPGIDLNPAGQLALAEQLSKYMPEQPFPKDAAPGTRYHLDNRYYPTADGSVNYAMLRHFRPKRVIEAGSGFTSACMLDTSEKFLGGQTQFTFVEPYPDRLHSLLTPADKERTTIHVKRVQDLPLPTFDQLEANDLLFIDSSHVGKLGSDVTFLFFEVLPRLKPGVLVHVHDIFWPFEFPRKWIDLGYAWNEAYLLRAVLMFSKGFELLLWPSYLETHHAARWAELMPLAQQRASYNPDFGGATIWLRRV
jgi:predicted O-methyltransferase YrrM